MKKSRTILLPLARQLLFILLFFGICTTGIVALTTYAYTNFQLDNLNSSLEFYSARLAKTTRESYENYENICYSIAYNQAVQTWLSRSDGRDDYDNFISLYKQLDSTSRLDSYIVDIAVTGDSGRFASLCSSIVNYQDFMPSLRAGSYSYRCAGVTVINGITCHILTMPIYSFGSGESRHLGLLFLAIDIDSLFANHLAGDDNSYNPQILFTDSQNRLVYGEQNLYHSLLATSSALSSEEFASSFQLASEDTDLIYIANRYSIPAIDHDLYVLINRNESTGRIYSISRGLLLGMGLVILSGSLLIWLLYRPLISSLNQLTSFMKDISTGNRKAQREGILIWQGLIGSTEISDINEALNEMLLHTDDLNHTIFDTYTRMYELEASSRKTEIAFLRSQINPHFLYNTLTMICGMAAEGSTDKIISVTGALSQIFRYSIKGNDMVTLREEMEIVQSYLTIQEERFANRFQVKYAFEDNVMDFMIPRMVIQPLVENAIVHGLEKKVTPGSLLIGAGRNPEHSYLAIWIYDTGVGMPPEQLEALRKAVAHSPRKRKYPESPEGVFADPADADMERQHNIGILNVNDRMVLHFGSEYTLIIDSEEGVGTNVQIRVPY